MSVCTLYISVFSVEHDLLGCSRFQNTAAMKIIIPMNGPGHWSGQCRGSRTTSRVMNGGMEDIKRHRNISRDTIPAHEDQKWLKSQDSSTPVIHIPAAAAGQRTSVYRVVPGSTAPRLPELASHLRARVYSELSVNCPHNICFPPQPRPGSCVSTLFCGEKCSSW